MVIDPQPEVSLLGTTVGEYRLAHFLGKGAMGMVFAAEHQRLGRMAAVKVLVPELARDRRALQRFFAEARVVARLQHPNVVDVVDMIETDTPGIIMELLRGQTLADALQAGPMEIERVVRITTQILDVLAVVHQQGIVHRDLKPQNVFLVDDGVRADFVKVLDFGMAKLQDGQGFGVSATHTGAILGTPLYMSPEQIDGGKIDARTDLYAVGAIVHEMLTGAPPFQAPTLVSLLAKQCFEPASPVDAVRPDVPASLAALVSRCLEKKPEDRFEAAREAREVLTGARDAGLSPRVTSRSAVAGAAASGATEAYRTTLGRASGEAIPAKQLAAPSRGRRIVAVAGGAAVVAAIIAFAVTRGDGDARKDSAQPPAPASRPAASTHEPERAAETTPTATADAAVVTPLVPPADAEPSAEVADVVTTPPVKVTTKKKPVRTVKKKPPRKRTTVKKRTQPSGDSDADTSILDE